MKKIFGFVLFCVLLAVPARAQSPRVGVSSPLLQQFGFGQQGQVITITNATPWFVELVVGGKAVALLGPGDTTWDEKRWRPHPLQLPILARAYADEEGKDLVGMAGQVLYIQPNQGGSYSPQPWTWTISPGEIRRIEGSTTPEVAPASNRPPGDGKMRLPSGAFGASAGGVQVANLTRNVLVFRANGREKARIPAGGVLYYEWRSLAGWGQQFSAQLVALEDDGSFAGATHPRQVQVPWEGTQSWQWLVSSGEFIR